MRKVAICLLAFLTIFSGGLAPSFGFMVGGPGGAARITYTSNVNFVVDGNSLIAGVGASNAPTNALPALVAGLPPVSGVIPAVNLGIGGQTTRMMDGLDNGSSADVDGAYVAGKINVLVVWEGTNSICVANRTAAQAISDLKTYIANRRAAHPWKAIIVMTTLPRQGAGSTQADVVAYNAILQAYDDTLRANYRALGIDALVDVRQPGSPFLLSDYSDASFAALPYWYESSYRTHLNDAGYALVAQMVAAVLRRLPLRLAANDNIRNISAVERTSRFAA